MTASAAGLSLASYKIRIRDNHVRALPATSPDGTPFAGPGVDLRGDDAKAVIEAAAPVLQWLHAREPDVRIRSVSVSLHANHKNTNMNGGHPRVLVSLEPSESDPRPRALRFDPPSSIELCDAARNAERLIVEACIRILAARR